MAAFSEFQSISTISNPVNKPVIQEHKAMTKIPDLPNDTVEITHEETKAPVGKNNGFINVATMLTAAAAVVCAGTYGGVKLYDKFFQKLASGVRKGEINEALFNFIKKTDPKGRLFNDKEAIIKINEQLTDENFLILKKLSKMKNEYSFIPSIYRDKRFNLKEITELLQSTNEYNIKYLNQLAQINKGRYGTERSLSSGEILRVMKEISPENDKSVGLLIEKANADDAEELVKCLQSINKDNSDFYSLILSTRRKGGPTELSFDDIRSLASSLEKNKNPKCTEFLLNLEKADGSGSYRHSVKELDDILVNAKDENFDVIKQLYEMKCTESLDEMTRLVSSVNKDNISLVEKILNKDYKSMFGSQYVVFQDWGNIETIIKNTNSKNIDAVSKIIDICDTSSLFVRIKGEYKDLKVPNVVEKLAIDSKDNPALVERINNILEKGMQDGKQTLDIKTFVEKLDMSF